VNFDDPADAVEILPHPVCGADGGALVVGDAGQVDPFALGRQRREQPPADERVSQRVGGLQPVKQRGDGRRAGGGEVGGAGHPT
jgi:hypothetical protein